MKRYGKFSTRLFGTQCAENGIEPEDNKKSFTVKDFADFNHLSERFFLEDIDVKVPRDHPRRPLDEDQARILDAHIVINDHKDRFEYIVKDYVNINAFDLGWFIIRPEQHLHLSPEAIISVDVFAESDFFFKINYFITPL